MVERRWWVVVLWVVAALVWIADAALCLGLFVLRHVYALALEMMR